MRRILVTILLFLLISILPALADEEVVVVIKDKEPSWLISIEKDKTFEEINAFSASVSQRELALLKSDPNLKVFPDKKFHIELSDSINIINATMAHKLVAHNNITGKGIVACILDTGIDYTHESLQNKFIGGYDFVNSDNDPLDDNGHGTHVAGIFAANGLIQGIAPEASIAAVKVCDASGSCLMSNIIAGLDWCTSNKDVYNISIVSMSIGDGGSYDISNCPIDLPIEAVLESAFSNGIFVTAAAGNSPPHTSGISYPACSSNVIAAGAVDKSDNIQFKRGSLLKLLAPGSDIVSTWLNNGTRQLTGTSMSTPHIAGAAALLQQYSFEDLGKLAWPKELEKALNDSGKRLYDSGTGLEFSRIDVYNAIFYLDNKTPEIWYNVSINKDNSSQIGNVTIYWHASDTNLELTYINLSYPNSEAKQFYENLTLLGGNLSYGNYSILFFAKDRHNIGSIIDYFYIEDLTKPKIVLDHPIDNYETLTNNSVFNCSASDDKQVSNITLFSNIDSVSLWEAKEVINNTHSTNFNASFLIENITDGQYKWNCLVFDNDSNYNWAENRTFTVDTNEPELSLISPEDNNTINSNSIDFSFSVNDLTLSNCSLIINDETKETKNLTNGGGIFSYVLSNSIYSWQIVCRDRLMHENQSETRTLTVNYQPPPTDGGNSGGGGGGGSRGGSKITKPTQTVAVPAVPIVYAPFPLISQPTQAKTEEPKGTPEVTGATTAFRTQEQRTPLQGFVSLDIETIRQELREFFELVREKARELFEKIKGILYKTK